MQVNVFFNPSLLHVASVQQGGQEKNISRLRASGHEIFFLIQAYCMLLARNREGNKKTFREAKTAYLYSKMLLKYLTYRTSPTYLKYITLRLNWR